MMSNEQNDSAQYLIFLLDGNYFAFDVLKTREVLTITPITPIPGTPEFMTGVLNLRGSVVPVMDLRKKFRMKVSDYTDDTSIIIVEASSGDEVIVMGALVDAVKGVRRFENSELEPPPRVGMKLNAELIHAIGKTDSEFILILNVDKVLSDEDVMIAREMTGDVPEAKVEEKTGSKPETETKSDTEPISQEA